MTGQEMVDEISSIVDMMKDILSPEIWNNILLDCTKNEVLVLWLLYRKEQVNMSQIAEYIHTPLNTATGIIARMEKRELIIREHSVEDKRIVTIRIGKKGQKQMQDMMKEISKYAVMITDSFSKEEMQLLQKMIRKIAEIMKQEPVKEEPKKKVKRITIE